MLAELGLDVRPVPIAEPWSSMQPVSHADGSLWLGAEKLIEGPVNFVSDLLAPAPTTEQSVSPAPTYPELKKTPQTKPALVSAGAAFQMPQIKPMNFQMQRREKLPLLPIAGGMAVIALFGLFLLMRKN